MDPRKEELERKKKRLEELRKTRDERQNELDKLKKQTKNTEEKFRERRHEVDSLVDEILSASPTKPGIDLKSPLIPALSPGSTSREAFAVSEAPGSSGKERDTTSIPVPRPSPNLQIVDVLFLDLPPKERITYTKEIQTDPLSPTLTTEIITTVSPVLNQRDVTPPTNPLENEVSEEDVSMPPSKSLTEDEKKAILESDTFFYFFHHSAHIMEKALSVIERFDFLKDYSSNLHATGQTSDSNSAKLINTFFSEKYTEGRTVTSIQWNPQFPELFFVSYSKSSRPSTQADGLVLVWNLFLPGTPEFILTCQSEITTALFSPFQPNILAAGTYSGQIVVWDTKTKQSKPKLKTPLSHSGHTHPITCAAVVGTATLHHLITSSNDGCICAWPLDLLSQPSETLRLAAAAPAAASTLLAQEIGVTCFAFAMNETTQFYACTDAGVLMHVQRYDRPGCPAGILSSWPAHVSCITHLAWHPVQAGPFDFSSILLTCSLDWTVKLWRQSKLIFQFDVNHDYVLDVQWSPTHPAVFATCNGAGYLDIYNLNLDPEMYSCRIKIPSMSGQTSEIALNKLCFDKEGKKIATGTSDGKIYIYELDDRFSHHEDDRALFQKTLMQLESMNEKRKVDVDN